ncbi:MAG TPA: amidase [Ilumatobacter sp.]|nr:amidase [Ilumatobacter sp.]
MSADPNSPHARTAAALRRIDEYDPVVAAFVEVLTDRALAEARTLPATGNRPLHGIPVAVKELFDVEHAGNSYGSLTRAGMRATSDAAVVERLRSAGAIVLGTTRSHEFGWGITTQHETRGSTRNPHDLTRIPGGSSGGSAAAVAAGFVPLAIGTDTGGSIRIPAAFCGVLGLKTTPGRISRRGSVALAPTFDTPGLLAASVDLLALGLTALAGRDPADPATVVSEPLRPAPPAGVGFRFAVPDAMQPRPLTTPRRVALAHITDALETGGGCRIDADVPEANAANDVFVPQIMAEAHFVHATALGTWPLAAESYGRDVAARLRAAEAVTLADYLAARAESNTIRSAFARIFQSVDVLVNVVGAAGPSTVDDPDRIVVEGRSMSLLAATMPSTLPQNVARLPSLTVPAGVDPDGLPIGVQLTGAPWSEPLLIEVGRRLERSGAIAVVTVTPSRGVA